MRYLHTVLAGTLIGAVLLSGCSSQPEIPIGRSAPALEHPAKPNWVERALYAQYRAWKGVRYEYGGLSKHGVDCSGFVYLTYEQRFGIILPRSTEGQVLAGPEIPQRELEPGDLVFFKTGWTTHHVGIYIGDGKFLHVSSSHGVMISYLDNIYWRHHYWTAVRVQPDSPDITYVR